MELASCSATPLPCKAWRISVASRPISSTARTCWRTGAARGSKSCPLPSPPKIKISERSCPKPCKAATVAPTLVPLLSSKYSTAFTTPNDCTRCGSPLYSRSPNNIGPSAQPVALAKATAAKALQALCRPRMRSASAGIRRCKNKSSTGVLRPRFSVASVGAARTSQTTPLTSSRP